MKKHNKTFDLDFCESSIKTFAGQRESMLKSFRKGKEAGSKTYVRDIDNIQSGGQQNKMWSWKAGEFNLWTGYNNEGKSQFLIFLRLRKELVSGIIHSIKKRRKIEPFHYLRGNRGMRQNHPDRPPDLFF